MKIAPIQLTTPIFRYKTVVHHFTPRKPTVFERRLLHVHDRLATHETYNGISLERIFSDILGVGEPDALIQPALEQLVMLEVLRCQTDFSTLRTLSLRDLERTPRGDQMLQEDMLPAVSVDNVVTHLYDPIGQVLIGNGKERSLRNEPSSLAVSHEPFQKAYPASLIGQAIPQAGYDWWHPNSRIANLRRGKTEVLWREAKGAIDLSDQGRLSFVFPDEALTAYVNGLDDITLFEQFVRPVLVPGAEPQWQKLLGSQDSRELCPLVRALFPVSELAERVDWKGGVRLVRELPNVLPAPKEAPGRTAIVIFHDSETPEEDGVHWNPDRDGALIRLAEPFPIPDGFYWNGNGSCLGASRLSLSIGNSRHTIPLAYAYKEDCLPERLHASLAVIAQKLVRSERPEDRMIAVLWQPPDEVWASLFAGLSEQKTDFAESVAVLLTCRERFQALTGTSRVPDWDVRVCDLFMSWLDRQEDVLPIDALSKTVSALARCDVHDQEGLVEAAKAVQDEVAPPESMEDLKGILDVLQMIAPLDQLPFPSPLYTHEVLRDYVSRFVGDAFESLLADRSPLEKTLRVLKELQGRLRSFLGRASSGDTASTPQAFTVSACVDRNALRETCNQWVREWSRLIEIAPSLTGVLPGTAMLRIHRDVERLRGLLGKPKDRQPTYSNGQTSSGQQRIHRHKSEDRPSHPGYVSDKQDRNARPQMPDESAQAALRNVQTDKEANHE